MWCMLWQPGRRIDRDNDMKILCNVLLYQLIWFGSVLGGTPGLLVSLLLILVHLAFSTVRSDDLRMMGALLCIGLVVDGTLHYVGFFSFTISGFPLPLWLIMIWLGLALTPHHSLAWLQNRPLLSSFFGALGGPVAYWAGVRLGAATFHWSLPASLVTLALVWAVLWPLIMYISVVSKTASRTRQFRRGKDESRV